MTPPPGLAIPATPRPAPPEEAESPRLDRLRRALAEAPPADLDGIVAAFWAQAAAGGGPLVEPVDGDPGARAVTFLWRAAPDLREALVLVNRLVDRTDLAASALRAVAGTDVRFRTYRLPAAHRGSYKFALDVPAVAGAPRLDQAAWSRRVRSLDATAPDPLNPRGVPERWGGVPSSLLELPDAPPQPWRARRPDGAVRRGTLTQHRVASARLGNERRVWLHVPDAEPPPEGFRTVVVLDGDVWFGPLALQDTLDNLRADGAIPPLVAVAPEAIDNPTRMAELGGNPAWADFLADELLPWAGERAPLAGAPSHRVVAGQSLGGLAAMLALDARPDAFGAAQVQSPSLWWSPPDARDARTGRPQDEWLVRRLADAPERGLRFDLGVGTLEWGMREATAALAERLAARGELSGHVEFAGGHDYPCWHSGLADGLARLT